MSTPTEQIQTSIPSYLKDPILRLVGQAERLSQLGYQPYARQKVDAQGRPVFDAQGKPVLEGIQRVEDFNPAQIAAFENIAAMREADQLRQATGFAGLAGLNAPQLGRYQAYGERVPMGGVDNWQGGSEYDKSKIPSGFDWQAYVSAPQNVDLLKAGIDTPEEAERHYAKYGAGEGRALGTPGSTFQSSAFYNAPSFERMPTSFERVSTDTLAPEQMAGIPGVMARGFEAGRMGPAERVGAERFGLGAMQEYMSPYMQGVVERQKKGAVQDYMRQLPNIGAAAARMGARGGTREALLQSEARRSLSERLGDIEAQGLQQAYQQAASQFGQDRAAQLQAALANQAAGLTTGQQNLGAYQQAQIANQQADLQGQLANQQMGYNVGLQNLQALINQRQFGAGQGLQARQLNQAAQLQAQQQALAQLAQANQFNQQNAMTRAQYGLAGANLAEQSRQFGAGLGLQGLQQQLAAAGMLGNLGMQQYQQQMGINAAQLGAGGQQQALGQELLNQQYQDFLNAQRLPYQQAEFMSGILRGLPATGQTQTMYQAPGSMFGQIAGVGLGLGSLFGGLGSTTGGK